MAKRVKLRPTASEATVYEAALGTGSQEMADADPGNNSDGRETVLGAITTSGGTTGYTYRLSGTGSGTYGTLTLGADGTYSYTLARRYDTGPDRGGSIRLNSLAGSISGLPAGDHAAARSGRSKYTWSGDRPPRLECGRMPL